MNDAMLNLARAVYPDRDVAQHLQGFVVMWPKSSAAPGMFDTTPGVVFDPANNADQFCDVLAWLFKQDKTYSYSEMTKEYVWVASHDMEVPHDGTASGIRRAVVQAAMRVVEGE